MENKETVVLPLQEAVLFHSGEVLSYLGKQTSAGSTQVIFTAV